MMDRRDVETTSVIAITGGYLPQVPQGKRNNAFDQSHHWIAPLIERGGKQFVVIERSSVKFRQFCNAKFDMLLHLQDLRNKKLEAILEESRKKAEDVDDDEGGGGRSTPTMMDVCDANEIVQVDVQRDSGIQTVLILSVYNKNQCLSIEYTPDNLDMLLDDPKKHDMVPTIDQPNVSWRTRYTHLRVRVRAKPTWTSKPDRQFKWMSRAVHQLRMSFDEWQSHIHTVAAEMQQLYNESKNNDDADDADDADDVEDAGEDGSPSPE